MLTPKDKQALLKFLKDWSKPLNEILNARFGKRKVAHILIAIDTETNPSITYTTNLRDGDFKRCLKLLSDNMNERRIETLN